MKQRAQKGKARSREGGYALLLVMFFLALLVIASAAVAPNVLTNGKREKEAEMVWRGRQYARGVRMYYQKFQRFPTSLDDLTKPKSGIRFMRQAYKDPMNGADGSWRLIYVGPNGQLIGSLKSRTLNMTGIGGMGALGTAGGTSSFGNTPLGGSTLGGTAAASSGFGNSSFGNSSFGSSSITAPNPNPEGAAPGSQSATSALGGDSNNPDSTDAMGTPHDLGTMDASNVIGGNIIGVGSKVNQKSLLWYDKAKNYRQFEFIWDPSKDMTVGAAAKGIGTPIQNMNTPGSTATGTGTGLSGTSPTQNPNPNPNENPPLQAPPQ
jgi:hypothetical protein